MGKQLPKNWAEVQLEEILEKLENGSRPKGGVQGILEGIPSLGGEHLDSDGGFKFGKLKYVPEAFAKKMNRGLIKENDILIVKDGATTGKTSFVDNKFPYELAFVNEHVFISRTFSNINSKAIFYFLNSKLGQERILDNFTGSAQGGINQKFVTNTLIPLPPLQEQHRIVAKLDKLFTQLETIKISMANIPLLLKDFRQQVLTQAVTGKLTKEWRKGKELGNISFLEIEKEREKLKKLKAINDGKKSFTYKKSLPPVLGTSTKGIDELFKLPESWNWISLDQITWNISDGPHFSPSYSDSQNGKRFISMRNITPQGINFEDCKYVSIDDHNEFIKRGKPEKGDIIYTKGGSTGIPCLIGTDTDFSYWVHVALLKTISKFVDSKYLRNTLLSSLCYKQSQAFTHGVGNQDLGLTRMTNIVFPLPSLQEQQEIVRRVESLFAKADLIEQQYKVLKASIDTLPQALLHKAFKGELTEQLDSDGDARELLEEIKVLKAATGKAFKSKTNKIAIKKEKPYSETEEVLGMVAEEHYKK